MRVLFRTDANARIGTGHISRCLALAAELREGGAECIFLCRTEGLGALAARIAQSGHRLVSVEVALSSTGNDEGAPLAHAAWLPWGQRADAAACLVALDALTAGDPAAWLVVDHYALDARWERAMRPAATRILAIDDLADRQHDCDLLLDQNLAADMASRYDSKVAPDSIRLLGPSYALLRSEFRDWRLRPPLSPDSSAPRLLVMFGGADPQNLTLRAVQAIERIGWRGGVDVVAGPLYVGLDELRAAVAALPAGLLHAPANDIAALMAQAGFAVGSPGVASWERCTLGLPTVAIAQADNQEGLGKALAESGAHWYMGRAERLSEEELDAALRLGLGNSYARRAMAAAARRICDGRGALRAAGRLLAPVLRIRAARADDASMLFIWRNDERTRRWALDSSLLDPLEHTAWYAAMLARPDTDLLLACQDDRPVASIRFDRTADRARISIYIDPELQGRGLGLAGLTAALSWLRDERPDVRVVEADVLPANCASLSIFMAAGFDPAWTRYERVQTSGAAAVKRNESELPYV